MFLDPNKPIDRHRVNLPHWQQDQTWVFVTWRLADSLPQSVVGKLATQRRAWEKNHPKPWTDEVIREHNRKFTLGFEKLLDDAHGECILAQESFRDQVSGALLYFNADRYEIDEFVVMPNHVHVLFRPLRENRLEDIMQTWKRYSARQINQMRGQHGSLWQSEYWDRLIRTEKQFLWTRNYIEKNPEKLSPNAFTLWSRDLKSLNV
jgi:REP element-mobilizing transposase RayT